MHSAALAALLMRHHDNAAVQDVLQRLDKDVLIGTLVYSDPATGGHGWYPLSSKTRRNDDGSIQLIKYGSWSTSAGFADFYVAQAASPDFDGDYSNLSVFLVFKDEIRANSDDWQALGMHGNQSSAMILEAKLPAGRVVGPIGDGAISNDEVVDDHSLTF
ncbi:PREDICTED: uncharacterized protein LOC106817119 [Priapulus caudatus]|uniref:Uncharacterized protein LOC106817119 n=1 Tax=Priapulus caudatus TaxID=37621 RepID=A0ABM1EYI2_PRICU|nr:PREDICTED: uncharacterized protein LOC106817119 [Priapulus caudatus]